MKPGESEAVLCVLDRKAERKIVFDAIEDQVIGIGLNTFVPRFKTEAGNKNSNSFEALPQDRDMLRAAAEHTLESSSINIFYATYNKLTGRTKAAKQILKFI